MHEEVFGSLGEAEQRFSEALAQWDLHFVHKYTSTTTSADKRSACDWLNLTVSEIKQGCLSPAVVMMALALRFNSPMVSADVKVALKETFQEILLFINSARNSQEIQTPALSWFYDDVANFFNPQLDAGLLSKKDFIDGISFYAWRLGETVVSDLLAKHYGLKVLSTELIEKSSLYNGFNVIKDSRVYLPVVPWQDNRSRLLPPSLGWKTSFTTFIFLSAQIIQTASAIRISGAPDQNERLVDVPTDSGHVPQSSEQIPVLELDSILTANFVRAESHPILWQRMNSSSTAFPAKSVHSETAEAIKNIARLRGKVSQEVELGKIALLYDQSVLHGVAKGNVVSQHRETPSYQSICQKLKFSQLDLSEIFKTSGLQIRTALLDEFRSESNSLTDAFPSSIKIEIIAKTYDEYARELLRVGDAASVDYFELSLKIQYSRDVFKRYMKLMSSLGQFKRLLEINIELLNSVKVSDYFLLSAYLTNEARLTGQEVSKFPPSLKPSIQKIQTFNLYHRLNGIRAGIYNILDLFSNYTGLRLGEFIDDFDEAGKKDLTLRTTVEDIFSDIAEDMSLTGMELLKLTPEVQRVIKMLLIPITEDIPELLDCAIEYARKIEPKTADLDLRDGIMMAMDRASESGAINVLMWFERQISDPGGIEFPRELLLVFYEEYLKTALKNGQLGTALFWLERLDLPPNYRRDYRALLTSIANLPALYPYEAMLIVFDPLQNQELFRIVLSGDDSPLSIAAKNANIPFIMWLLNRADREKAEEIIQRLFDLLDSGEVGLEQARLLKAISVYYPDISVAFKKRVLQKLIDKIKPSVEKLVVLKSLVESDLTVLSRPDGVHEYGESSRDPAEIAFLLANAQVDHDLSDMRNSHSYSSIAEQNSSRVVFEYFKGNFESETVNPWLVAVEESDIQLLHVMLYEVEADNIQMEGVIRALSASVQKNDWHAFLEIVTAPCFNMAFLNTQEINLWPAILKSKAYYMAVYLKTAGYSSKSVTRGSLIANELPKHWHELFEYPDAPGVEETSLVELTADNPKVMKAYAEQALAKASGDHRAQQIVLAEQAHVLTANPDFFLLHTHREKHIAGSQLSQCRLSHRYNQLITDEMISEFTESDLNALPLITRITLLVDLPALTEGISNSVLIEHYNQYAAFCLDEVNVNEAYQYYLKSLRLGWVPGNIRLVTVLVELQYEPENIEALSIQDSINIVETIFQDIISDNQIPLVARYQAVARVMSYIELTQKFQVTSYSSEIISSAQKLQQEAVQSTGVLAQEEVDILSYELTRITEELSEKNRIVNMQKLLKSRIIGAEVGSVDNDWLKLSNYGECLIKFDDLVAFKGIVDLAHNSDSGQAFEEFVHQMLKVAAEQEAQSMLTWLLNSPVTQVSNQAALECFFHAVEESVDSSTRPFIQSGRVTLEKAVSHSNVFSRLAAKEHPYYFRTSSALGLYDTMVPSEFSAQLAAANNDNRLFNNLVRNANLDILRWFFEYTKNSTLQSSPDDNSGLVIDGVFKALGDTRLTFAVMELMQSIQVYWEALPYRRRAESFAKLVETVEPGVHKLQLMRQYLQGNQNCASSIYHTVELQFLKNEPVSLFERPSELALLLSIAHSHDNSDTARIHESTSHAHTLGLRNAHSILKLFSMKKLGMDENPWLYAVESKDMAWLHVMLYDVKLKRSYKPMILAALHLTIELDFYDGFLEIVTAPGVSLHSLGDRKNPLLHHAIENHNFPVTFYLHNSDYDCTVLNAEAESAASLVARKEYTEQWRSLFLETASKTKLSTIAYFLAYFLMLFLVPIARLVFALFERPEQIIVGDADGHAEEEHFDAESELPPEISLEPFQFIQNISVVLRGNKIYLEPEKDEAIKICIGGEPAAALSWVQFKRVLGVVLVGKPLSNFFSELDIRQGKKVYFSVKEKDDALILEKIIEPFDEIQKTYCKNHQKLIQLLQSELADSFDLKCQSDEIDKLAGARVLCYQAKSISLIDTEHQFSIDELAMSLNRLCGSECSTEVNGDQLVIRVDNLVADAIENIGLAENLKTRADGKLTLAKKHYNFLKPNCYKLSYQTGRVTIRFPDDLVEFEENTRLGQEVGKLSASLFIIFVAKFTELQCLFSVSESSKSELLLQDKVLATEMESFCNTFVNKTLEHRKSTEFELALNNMSKFLELVGFNNGLEIGPMRPNSRLTLPAESVCTISEETIKEYTADTEMPVSHWNSANTMTLSGRMLAAGFNYLRSNFVGSKIEAMILIEDDVTLRLANKQDFIRLFNNNKLEHLVWPFKKNLFLESVEYSSWVDEQTRLSEEAEPEIPTTSQPSSSETESPDELEPESRVSTSVTLIPYGFWSEDEGPSSGRVSVPQASVPVGKEYKDQVESLTKKSEKITRTLQTKLARLRQNMEVDASEAAIAMLKQHVLVNCCIAVLEQLITYSRLGLSREAIADDSVATADMRSLNNRFANQIAKICDIRALVRCRNNLAKSYIALFESHENHMDDLAVFANDLMAIEIGSQEVVRFRETPLYLQMNQSVITLEMASHDLAPEAKKDYNLRIEQNIDLLLSRLMVARGRLVAGEGDLPFHEMAVDHAISVIGTEFNRLIDPQEYFRIPGEQGVRQHFQALQHYFRQLRNKSMHGRKLTEDDRATFFKIFVSPGEVSRSKEQAPANFSPTYG